MAANAFLEEAEYHISIIRDPQSLPLQQKQTLDTATGASEEKEETEPKDNIAWPNNIPGFNSNIYSSILKIIYFSSELDKIVYIFILQHFFSTILYRIVIYKNLPIEIL